MSNPAKLLTEPPAGTRIDPWRVHPQPMPAGASARNRQWIQLSGSMTEALGRHLGGQPLVTPICEGPGRIAPWEARLLRTPARSAYVREVVLTVGGAHALSARTLSLLRDPAVDVLRRLANRPLAEVLFQDPDWQRWTPPIPVIEAGRGRPGRACVWGYRCRAGRTPQGGSRILVTEYFEPALLAGRPVAAGGDLRR